MVFKIQKSRNKLIRMKSSDIFWVRSPLPVTARPLASMQHGTTDQVGTDLFRTSAGDNPREKAQRLKIEPTCSAP